MLLGVVLFAFSAGFPPFDDLTEVDLSVHMLQHVLIILAGVLIAYPHFLKRRNLGNPVAPWASLLAAGALIVFWHIPGPWDAAVLNPSVHLVEHLSFLAVGLLVGSWILGLSDSAKIGVLLAAFFGHMGYAVALILPWSPQVYSLYSVADQVILGWVLLLTGPSLIVGVAYIVAKNPDWLGGFSGKKPGPKPGWSFLQGASVPAWVVPCLVLTLLLTASSYFAMTAVALGGLSGGGSEGGATITMVETPVTWQYSPQVAHVVLGVNSTVTWVSHSISYDTVTSRNGTFDSGPIAPGGTFTYTFHEAGTYQYYCVYHPWMTGAVVVSP